MTKEIDLTLSPIAISYLLKGLESLNAKAGNSLQESANILTLNNVLGAKLKEHEAKALPKVEQIKSETAEE